MKLLNPISRAYLNRLRERHWKTAGRVVTELRMSKKQKRQEKQVKGFFALALKASQIRPSPLLSDFAWWLGGKDGGKQ